MSFGKNFRYLRRTRKFSQDYIAEQFGYKSFTTIQKWEDGSAVPPYSVITRLADFFNVSVDELMNTDLSLHFNTEIPVLGTVRGGSPILANQEYRGFEHVIPDDAAHGDCFYLEVVGDSMKDARILPGDLLYVHRQDYLNNGDIGVVLIDDEATVKTVYFKGDTMILQPANDAYEPIVLSARDQEAKNVHVIGKVLHNRIKFS
ncbi:MAG: helix-turn-helix domain-containing protein [Erysipelotrichaceae bacterium]|nr:helix-turn-helix domain-containing protein [Erysipelotrichaceae bacterium]